MQPALWHLPQQPRIAFNGCEASNRRMGCGGALPSPQRSCKYGLVGSVCKNLASGCGSPWRSTLSRRFAYGPESASKLAQQASLIAACVSWPTSSKPLATSSQAMLPRYQECKHCTIASGVDAVLLVGPTNPCTQYIHLLTRITDYRRLTLLLRWRCQMHDVS